MAVAGKGRRSGMSLLADALTPDHRSERKSHNSNVCHEGLVIHVPNVELKFFIPSQRVPSHHLRHTRDARLDVVAPFLKRGVEGNIFRKQGARPNQAHVAPDDIPQLGKLIEAG